MGYEKSGDGRRARIDPRDGKLKDTRDFARESAKRRERNKDRVRDRVEPGESTYDREKNEQAAKYIIREMNKSSTQAAQIQLRILVV